MGQSRRAAKLLGLAAFLLALLTVPLYALVWVPRSLLRRLRGLPALPALRLRVLPLLAWLSVLAMLLDFGLAQDDFHLRFGTRTVWSVLFTAGTWAFALASLGSLWAVLRTIPGARRAGINRWAHAHSLAVSLAFALAVLYLACSGFIGYRSWL